MNNRKSHWNKINLRPNFTPKILFILHTQDLLFIVLYSELELVILYLFSLSLRFLLLMEREKCRLHEAIKIASFW